MGGTDGKVESDKPEQMFSWVRRKEGNVVVGLFNLSAVPVTAILADSHAAGSYSEFGTGQSITLKAGDVVTLPAWGFRLLARNKDN